MKILYSGDDRVQGLSVNDIHVSEEDEDLLSKEVQGSQTNP
jgi:hypothetical protein